MRVWIEYIDWSCGEPSEPQDIDMKRNDEGDIEIDLPGGVGVVKIKKEKFQEVAALMEITPGIRAANVRQSVIISGSNNVIG